MEYTITLTEAEAKAMSFICADVQDWIQNAASNRARIAMQEVFEREVQRMIADPTTTAIPADIETVVLGAVTPESEPPAEI